MKGECADKRGSGEAGNFGAVYRMDLDVSRGRPRLRLNRVTGGGGVGRAGRGGAVQSGGMSFSCASRCETDRSERRRVVGAHGGGLPAARPE